ncbi:MAG TPA: GNAT family N-acetyltransferase [Oculatellaceae cyanobacterium]
MFSPQVADNTVQLSVVSQQTSRVQNTEKTYTTQLEPTSLIDAFLEHPPVGFGTFKLPSARFSGKTQLPAFLTRYDLSLTADGLPQWLKTLYQKFSVLAPFVQPLTLFVGTTVSEYCLLPENQLNVSGLLQHVKTLPQSKQADFIIFKDLPQNSPLLNQADEAVVQDLTKQCQRQNWLLLEGQALAYVDIDFDSIDQYLSRLSYSRRKEFRRKLRSSSQLRIKEVRTGNPLFFDETFMSKFYSMYENVYQQSETHFDKLSTSFFKKVLQTDSDNGIVFLYYRDDALIGWNLCFIQDNHLIDKYIGLQYPEAREANLYFVSWFHNLKFALENRLTKYVAGWTDHNVKASLGAQFTMTRHAVYIRNPLLRAFLGQIKHVFECELVNSKGV